MNGKKLSLILGIIISAGIIGAALGKAGQWIDHRYAKSTQLELIASRVTLNDLASWIRQNQAEMAYLRSKYGCEPNRPCRMDPRDNDRYNFLVNDTNELIKEYNELKAYLRKKHKYRYR